MRRLDEWDMIAFAEEPDAEKVKENGPHGTSRVDLTPAELNALVLGQKLIFSVTAEYCVVLSARTSERNKENR